MSEWTDEDGQPLGEWVQVNEAEWRDLFYAAGGWDDLTVFSSLTDPHGQYGAPQIYTAWGVKWSPVPLLDIRDYKDREGKTEESVMRKFVAHIRALEGKR